MGDDLTIHYSEKHDLSFFHPKDIEISGPDSPLSAWIAAAQDWKDSGRTEPAPTDVSAPEYSEGDEYFLSENEEVVTKLSLPPLIKEESSSDSSSGNSSSGRKKSKHRRNSEKALASVKKLEISQNNTDAQLKIIADNHKEIKSLFINAQSAINTAKESVNDLNGKHEINENTV